MSAGESGGRGGGVSQGRGTPESASRKVQLLWPCDTESLPKYVRETTEPSVSVNDNVDLRRVLLIRVTAESMQD